MTGDSSSIELFFRLFSELAEPVGFAEVSELPVLKEVEAPAGSRLWASPYARLFVCPLPVGEIEAGPRILLMATEWLDELLRRYERKGLPMDGYLLLALSSSPNQDTLRWIRTIELDPSFFRKHVLWAEDGHWERQLEKVTVLGLQSTPSPAKPAEIPQLPKNPMKAWEMFSKRENIRSIADHILSEAGLSDEGGSVDEG